MSDQVCTYCTETAQFEENISPLVCLKHADLQIIIGYLEGKGQQITLDAITTAYRLVAHHGAWTITEPEIAPMLAQMREESTAQ